MGISFAIIYRPLIPAAAAMLIGIGLGAVFPDRVMPAAGLVMICMALTIIAILRRRSALAAPLLLWTAVGYLLPQPWLDARLPPDHVGRYVDGEKWCIDGRIVGRPQIQAERMQLTLAVERLRRDDRTLAVRGNVRITVTGNLPQVHGEDRLALCAKLYPIRNFRNPDGFDYARFLAWEDIRARGYLSGEEIEIVKAADRLRTPVESFRREILARMREGLAERSSEAVELLAALTLGERAGLSPELNDAFNRTGLAHLLSISGLHVGMVATAAFAAAAWCLAWLPPLLKRGWTRRGAALCALGVTLIYGVLAGLTPPTQRALAMAGAFLLTFWISRRHDWFNALSMAALIVALALPGAVLGPSFQLSFAAVLAMLAGQRLYRPPVPQADRCLAVNLARRILALIWISLLATLGTLPLVLYYFNQLSLVGLAANIAAVPATGIVVLPAGMIGMLCAPINDTLALICWRCGAWVLEGLVLLVRFLASQPWAAVRVVTPSPAEILLYGAGALLIVNWRRSRRRWVWLGLWLAATAVDISYWAHRRFDDRRMTVQAIDVGQGSANLLQLPGGRTVLVDGGGFGDNTIFDVGRYVVAPFLWQRKIAGVDLVVLTHPHSDHLNGLIYVLEHFNVGEVWSNQEPCDLAACRQWREIVDRKGIFEPPFVAIPRRSERWGVIFECLSPPADFLSRKAAEKWRDDNNNSLVLKVSWGAASFLFTGDIGAPAEAEIVARHGADALRSTVLWVPHHGSRKSSSEAFLSAVRPQTAVISAGRDNRFGFPHEMVLQRLERLGCRILRIDRCGAVTIVSDGHAIHADIFDQSCR
jgi:competence protein ComEC